MTRAAADVNLKELMLTVQQQKVMQCTQYHCVIIQLLTKRETCPLPAVETKMVQRDEATRGITEKCEQPVRFS